MVYDGFDSNGDPLQHGAVGYTLESKGFTQVNGFCVGIVLRVHYSDSSDSLLVQELRGDSVDTVRGFFLEADVLLVFNGTQMYVQCPHVVIVPPGKTSNQGPGEDEPADFTEDVPNGCSDKELESFYGGDGRTGIDNLSGDWCLVGFLGGLFQSPVMISWFPNPNNRRDTAQKSDGKRFILRRRNSEFKIDQNGDLHFTHRVGQYLQMRGKEITIKHREGATISIGEQGNLVLMNKEGYSITLDESGIGITDGRSLIEIAEGVVRVQSTEGDMNVIANNITLMGESVVATAGETASALCKENMAEDYLKAVGDITVILTAIDTLLTAVKAILSATPPGAAAVSAYEAIGVKAKLVELGTLSTKLTSEYATKILAGE